MNKINTKISEFYNFLGVGGGVGAQSNSLPQAQKTLVTVLDGRILNVCFRAKTKRHKE
jgi:hypothetical protein